MEIYEIIDRMAEIKQEKKALENEYDKLQAQLHVIAGEELKDTKIKSVSYVSESGNSAQITNTDKVEISSVELLKDVFGITYPDMVKEEMKYTLKPAAKRMLSAIWKKEFCKGSIEDVIDTLGCDEKIRKQLLKKVKGMDFQKDKKTLMDYIGIGEKEASDAAYLISEAAAWQMISTLIMVNNNDQITNELLESTILKVNVAVNVDQEPRTKLTVAGGEDNE